MPEGRLPQPITDTFTENFANLNLQEIASRIDLSNPTNVPDQLVQFVNQIHNQVSNQGHVQAMDPEVGQYSSFHPDPVSQNLTALMIILH